MRSACRCPASRYCEYTHNIRDFAFGGRAEHSPRVPEMDELW